MPKKENNSNNKKNSKSSSNKKKTTAKNNQFINEYNQIVDVSSIIFLNEKTINLLKNSPDFQKIMTKLLSIGLKLEDNIQANKNENNLKTSIVAYENITNTKFKPIDVKNVNDQTEIQDEINYVKIFLLNSINLSLDDLMCKNNDTQTKNNEVNEEKNKSNETQNVETVDAKKINDSNQNNNSNYNQSGTPYRDAEDFLNKNNISLNEIANNIARQQAQVLLQSDIVNNRFYQYDSKPKFFVLSKYFMFALWALFFIVYLIFSIFQILLNDHPYALKDFAAEATHDYNDVVSNSIIYGGSSWISIVLVVLLAAMGFFMIFQLLKNRKNENVKYSFKSFISWIILFFTLMSVLIPLIMNPNTSILGMFSKINESKNFAANVVQVSVPGQTNLAYVSFNNPANYMYYLAYYILTIMLLTICGLILLGTVALMIIKPKNDVARMEQKINEYYNDIISGKIKIDDGNSFSMGGGFGSKNPFSPF